MLFFSVAPMKNLLSVIRLELWNTFLKQIQTVFSTAEKEIADYTTVVQREFISAVKDYLKGKFKENFFLESNRQEFREF